jgi:hypothetical protein
MTPAQPVALGIGAIPRECPAVVSAQPLRESALVTLRAGADEFARL